MRLCLPIDAPLGLASRIEAHLPSAEYLLFFDTETRDFQELSLREAMPDGTPAPNFDAVLCGSINRVTLRALLERGIAVYGTQAQTVLEAIAQLERGELVAADFPAVGGCHGHAHGGGCGCSHDDASGAHEHGEHGGAGGCGGGCGGGGCGNADQAGGCGGHPHGGHQHAGHEHGGHGCGCGGHRQPPQASRRSPRTGRLRIAVTSQNRKTVTEHAGKCRKFWVYEVDAGRVCDKTLIELPVEQSFHATGADQLHPLDGIAALITGSMGDGLRQRLLQRQIEGVVTAETDPDRAVAAYLAGD